MNKRYKVVDGSQSGHCCFGYTVVDTTRKVMIGDEWYQGQYEPVCECFELEDAQIVVQALNIKETLTPRPIATFPQHLKDEQEWVLLFCPQYGEPVWVSGFWGGGEDEDQTWYSSEAASHSISDLWGEPTHWLPLPPKPEGA